MARPTVGAVPNWRTLADTVEEPRAAQPRRPLQQRGPWPFGAPARAQAARPRPRPQPPAVVGAVLGPCRRCRDVVALLDTTSRTAAEVVLADCVCTADQDSEGIGFLVIEQSRRAGRSPHLGRGRTVTRLGASTRCGRASSSRPGAAAFPPARRTLRRVGASATGTRSGRRRRPMAPVGLHRCLQRGCLQRLHTDRRPAAGGHRRG